MIRTMRLSALGGLLLLVGCAQMGEMGTVAESPGAAAGLVAGAGMVPMATYGGAQDAARPREQSQRVERQGLATQLGRSRTAPVQRVTFFRKSGDRPDVIDQFYYNDREGARAMAERMGGGYGREKGGSFDLAGGRLRAALMDGGKDRAYRHIEIGNEICVVGELGREYVIELKNLSGSRIELVVSVDGLDVLSGRPASVKDRGYVVEAGSQVTIRGLREDDTRVRSFRFSDVASSEAAARGERQARSVGVVGVAIYEEDEAAALRAIREEGDRRLGAEAFPR